MRLNEVTHLNEQAIKELIELDNISEFNSEDLAKIVVTEQAGAWSEAMTADELLAEMDSWTK